MNAAAQPPQTIGRYVVCGELGQGAMGTVLRCEDPVLGRQVALKYLRKDLQLSDHEREELMRRMRQEAQAVAQVTHQGIVSLFDIGEDPELGVYLVFEQAEGPTLESALRRGRLTKEGTARLAREMGSALDAAHGARIVHRDIKPGNVILTDRGAKIADFGVARLPDSTLTRAGARVGTPAYSAPESIREGQHSEASDQFSFAACLYEGLSGRRAFPGTEAVEVARRIESESPLPIAKSLGLPTKVDRVLFRGMSRDPARRFTSCAELGTALSEALLGTREILPTLPDQRSLDRMDRETTSRRIGFIVLWLLVGATLAVLLSRVVPPPSLANQPRPTALPSGPPLRPAVLAPLPEK